MILLEHSTRWGLKEKRLTLSWEEHLTWWGGGGDEFEGAQSISSIVESLPMMLFGSPSYTKTVNDR